jgi:hypothetical protein
MSEEWTTVSKKEKSRQKHRYTEEKAQQLEAMAKCRQLAPALRSEEIEGFFEAGWDFVGVCKAGDDAIPDAEHIHKFVPVKNNRWGDLIVLQRPRTRPETGSE